MHAAGLLLTELVTEGAGILEHRSCLNAEGQADGEHGSRNGEAAVLQHLETRGREPPQAKERF
ncbi:hypothetical protein FORC31_p034 (plasmid) [Escherichia coli]|nr:hypothetical protein FORC31_p034 [Escherichia coli]